MEISVAELKRRLNHPENLSRISTGSGPASPLQVEKPGEPADTTPPPPARDSHSETENPQKGAESDESRLSPIDSLPVLSPDLDSAIDEILADSKPRKPHKRLTEEEHEVLGTLSQFQTQKSAADLLGVTQPVAFLDEHGLKGTTALEKREENRPLAEKIKGNLIQIAELSSNVALQSLLKITPEKLDKLRVTDLAKVAKDAAIVLEKSTGHRQAPAMSQVVVVASGGRSLSDYTVVKARRVDSGTPGSSPGHE